MEWHIVLCASSHKGIAKAEGETMRSGMRLSRAFQVLVTICILGVFPAVSMGVEPGFEMTKACRANLAMLNKATAQYIKDGHGNLPTWGRLKEVYMMCLTTKYLPKLPDLPTPDCAYFLVYSSGENFDWYCDLHGLIGGDKTYTFRYHEFQIQARANSKYYSIGKYKTHDDNLLRWCGYVPTLTEDIKYHYSRNPFSTVVFVILGLFAAWFVYRNVFAP